MNYGFVTFQIINIVMLGLFLALPITALVTMFRRKLSSSETVLWIILILFFPLIGSIVFLAWQPKKRKRKRKNSEI